MDPRFEQLIGLLTASAERTKQLEVLNKQFTTDMGKATNIDMAKAAAKALQNGLTPFIEQEAKGDQESLGLARQLADATPTTPPTTPPTPGTEKPVRASDIAKHFRTLVQSMQLDARVPAQGEIATTLKSFDVEIKGLIVVEDNEARVVTPAPGTNVDPGQLSTIRMSFGSIPGITVRDGTPTEPIR